MPRQRPRRRRRRSAATESPTPSVVNQDRGEQIELSRRRRWVPTAGIVTALGFGIWLGWAFSGAGGFVEQIVLWIGVLMAGLGGGRLFRRSLQRRQQERNRRR